MEWTVEKIRQFVNKDFQSIAARMTKCILLHQDAVVKKLEERKIDTSKMPDNYVRTKAEGINEGLDFAIKLLKTP